MLGRFRTEALLYVAATLASAWLFTLLWGLTGAGDPYTAEELMKDELPRYLAASLPGILIMPWFAAGLAGRFTVHACGGEPERMVFYSRAWYLRKLAWDTLFAIAIFASLPMLGLGIFGALLVIAWFGVAAWLGARLSLWLNIGVMRGLSLADSVKASYPITAGKAFQLLLITVIPQAGARFLHWLLARFMADLPPAGYYLNSILEGAAFALSIGAYAAVYAKLSEAPGVPDGTPGQVQG